MIGILFVEVAGLWNGKFSNETDGMLESGVE